MMARVRDEQTYTVAWENCGTKGHGGPMSRDDAIAARRAWLSEQGGKAHIVPCDPEIKPSDAKEFDHDGCMILLVPGLLALGASAAAGLGWLAREVLQRVL